MSLRPQSQSQSQSTCWTCRLRKKKCPGCDASPDLAVPQACKTCISLNIPCYGFTANNAGSLASSSTALEGKPSWIDGTTAVDKAERVRKMDEIREGVKRATEGQRRERALRGLRSREERDRGRRQILGEEGKKIEEERQVGDEYVDGSSSSAIPGAVSRNPSLAVGGSISANALPAWNESILLGLPHPNPHLESILLMHYIDQILPLQFPFYQPPPAVDGGRGWLLAILLQTRPLYDAALSLATWHLNTLKRDYRRSRNTRQDVREEIRWKTEDREEFEYEQLLYTKAIKGLRERIEVLSHKGPDEGLKDSIEALACIVQLILLEVSKGDMESWRKHLLAAPDLHIFLRTYCQPHHLRLRSNAFSEELFGTSKKTTSLTFVDHAAMEFFSSVIIWFDILGSASTGLRPQYADICAAALGDVNSKVQLQNLMGCENWAMTIIRDIAVLEDWKRKMVADGLLSVRELVRKATDISQCLDISIARLVERATQFSNGYSTYGNDSGKRSKILTTIRVTHVFASAAQVYLNVVVSGPNPNLPEMRDSVARTLTALDALPSIELIRNVTWPFCIAGCMAAYDQEEKFRSLALAGKLDEYTFGTARKAVEVMEACWVIRRSSDGSQNGSDWFTAMKDLGSHVLLV